MLTNTPHLTNLDRALLSLVAITQAALATLGARILTGHTPTGTPTSIGWALLLLGTGVALTLTARATATWWHPWLTGTTSHLTTRTAPRDTHQP